MSELTPGKTIEPQGWMSAADTQAVMNALAEDGRVTALFVGGCVRNALLGEDIGDIDIATPFTPEQVTEKLQAAGIRAVPTGIEHGTVTAVIDKRGFEITTLRKDVETDGRRAVVAFTDDWREDAARRDFTMNTLLADAQGHVYDPTGKGIADLEARRVVFVGDAAQRIAEDYLRILRFFRFHAWYGNGEPDDTALKACAAAAGKISTLSAERVTQEFFKIMSVENPVTTLNLMFENKVLSEFSFPEYQPAFLRWFCDFQNRYGLAFLAARLFVLAGLRRDNIQVMGKKLLIPKVFQKDIEAIAQVLQLDDLDTDQSVKTAVYKYGRTASAQALMIELAQDRVANGYAPKALEIIQKWDIPDFPVTGEDMIKAGFEPGPELGDTLNALEDWWIAEGFTPGKTAILGQLQD